MFTVSKTGLWSMGQRDSSRDREYKGIFFTQKTGAKILEYFIGGSTVSSDFPIEILSRNEKTYLDCRDTCGSSDQDDLIDFIQVKLGILQCSLNWNSASVQQVTAHLFKLGPGDVLLNVLRAICSGCDEWEGDGGLSQRTELHLCLLCSFCQPLQGLHIDYVDEKAA